MTEKYLWQQGRATIWCPICTSSSPESQETLREIARIGLARFLVIARKADVDVTMEQQREIYEALLTWDPAGVPAEIDWLVHEHADRAGNYLIAAYDIDPLFDDMVACMPAWNANYYVKGSWNISEEQRIADELEPLLRDDD
jgi:hypothetical protein